MCNSKSLILYDECKNIITQKKIYRYQSIQKDIKKLNV